MSKRSYKNTHKKIIWWKGFQGANNEKKPNPKHNLLVRVPYQLRSNILPHPSPCLSLSPPLSLSLWALSSDGFWPTFRLQRAPVCVSQISAWIYRQSERARERWRDRESKRQRICEKKKKKIMSNEIEIQLCAVGTLSLPLHLCSNRFDHDSSTAFCTKLYFTIIVISLIKITIIITIRNTFNEQFMCAWSFFLKQFFGVKPIEIEPHNSHIWHKWKMDIFPKW